MIIEAGLDVIGQPLQWIEDRKRRVVAGCWLLIADC